MEQSFNSFLTLHREKALNAFFDELSVHLKQKISLETLITLYFNRSGSLAETSSEIIYFLDTKGLSASDRQTLAYCSSRDCNEHKKQRGEAYSCPIKGQIIL